MNIKRLKIQKSKIEDFKIEILKSLNLFDYKRDCVNEFEERIENYLNRQKDLKILVEINIEKLNKEIYDNNFSKLERYKREIPENYPFGASNMETQAYYEPIVCDEQYYKDVENIRKVSEKELEDLINNLKTKTIDSKFEFELK